VLFSHRRPAGAGKRTLQIGIDAVEALARDPVAELDRGQGHVDRRAVAAGGSTLGKPHGDNHRSHRRPVGIPVPWHHCWKSRSNPVLSKCNVQIPWKQTVTLFDKPKKLLKYCKCIQVKLLYCYSIIVTCTGRYRRGAQTAAVRGAKAALLWGSGPAAGQSERRNDLTRRGHPRQRILCADLAEAMQPR
jgi:hypothetical protein